MSLKKEELKYVRKEINCGSLGCVYKILNTNWEDYVLKLANEKILEKNHLKKVDAALENEILKSKSIIEKLQNHELLDNVLIVDETKFRKEIAVTEKSILMKYCDGNDLTTELTDHNIIKNVKNLVEKICQLLFVFHTNGLYHNDIKLDNIMLCGGKFCLIDFGFLNITDSGTPLYWYYPSYASFVKSNYKETEEAQKLRIKNTFTKIDFFYQRYKNFFTTPLPLTFYDYAFHYSHRTSNLQSKKDLYAFGVTLLYILYHTKNNSTLTDEEKMDYDKLQIIIGAFIFESNLNGIYNLGEIYNSYRDITFESLYENLTKNLKIKTGFISSLLTMCRDKDHCTSIPVIQSDNWPIVFENQKGGKTTCIHILGRRRRVIKKNNREYITYNKKRITLAKARNIQARQKTT